MSRQSIAIGVVALCAIGLMLWRPWSKPEASGTTDQVESKTASASEPGAENAQSPRQPIPGRRMQSETSEARVGRVTGVVLDADSGEPVDTIEVVFEQRGKESSAGCDANGAYEIELPAGEYNVRAVGQDVIAKAVPRVRIGTAAVQSVNLEVVRLATVRGVVVDETGAGIGDVEVVLRTDTKASKAFPSRGEIGFAVSDSDGSFEVAVPPGTVDLEAAIGDARVFVSVPDVASGGVIEGLRIVFSQGGEVRGVVQLPGGGPAENAEVLLAFRRAGTSAFDRRSATTDASGDFLFDKLVPGAYVLEAIGVGYGPSDPIVLAVAPDTLKHTTKLSLHSPLSLSGTVVDANGRPLSNVQVAHVRKGSKQNFEKAYTYADGTFEFTGKGPGPHRLRARKEGFSDARLDDVKAPSAELQLRMSPVGGFEGVVTDSEGKPVSDFTVKLTSSRKKTQEHSIVGASDGSFQIYPLDSGTYTVHIASSTRDLHSEEVRKVPAGEYGAASAVLRAKP